MPESTTTEQQPETTPAVGQQNQNQRRTNINRGSNSRNSNLATLAAAARSFKGKITELPIIGKQYENVGVAFEILQRAVSDYVVLNLQNGEHMAWVIENLEDNMKESGVGTSPSWDVKNKDDYGKQQEYSKKLDMYLKDEKTYDSNMKKVYTLFYGQCTPTLLSGIKSANNYTEMNKKKDLIWLLDLIRNISIGIDETENELHTSFQVNKRLMNQYQKPVEPIDEWFERFEENWNAAEAAGGAFVPGCLLKSEKYKTMNTDELKEATKAMYIFLQSDRIRFGNKMREIAEGVVLGHDDFPTTMDGAYRILADTQRRLDEDRLRRGSTWNRNTGSSHYGGGRGTRSPRNHENLPTIPDGARIVLGRDRRVYTAQCYNCQEWGHFADQCPETEEGNGQ